MADSKITALDNLTSADPANDMIPIVDVSATPPASGNTKRISINNLLACSPSATLASATITGDLTVDTSTLKVDSANNRVGIGTASPANQLSVRNEAASGIAVIDVRGGTGGAGSVQISGNGTTLSTSSFDLIQNSLGALIVQRDANPLSMLVNGSERYAISSSGVATWSNVGGVASTAMTLNATGLGVGVSPSQRLHVKLDQNAYTYSRIDNQNASSGAYAALMLSASGNSWGIGVGSAAANSNALDFFLDAGGANSLKMRLDASGGLQIGRTSVIGTNNRLAIQMSGTSASGYSAAGNAALAIDAGISTNCVLNFVGGGQMGIYHSNSSNAFDVGIDFGDNSNRILTFTTATSERVRIKSTGQVRFVPLAADPSGAEAGDVYYNSSSNKLKCYNGSTWNDLF